MKIIAIQVFKRFRNSISSAVHNSPNTKRQSPLKRGAFGVYIIKVWYTCVQANKRGKVLAGNGNDRICWMPGRASLVNRKGGISKLSTKERPEDKT